MKRSVLAKCLKCIEIFIVLVGAFFYINMLPSIIRDQVAMFPEYASWEAPCVAAVSLTAVPILIGLVAFWQICTDIARNQSFSRKNGKRLSIIGACAIADTVYFSIVSLLLFGFGAYNPGLMLLSVMIMLIGLAASIAAFLLSHLVGKASAMEDDIKLTV